MFRTTLLVGLASLTLATSVQALPKIEGSWPVAEVEAALAKKLFTEEQRRNSCNASGHCTRVFFSDEVGSRVDIAVKGDQVYRVVCVDECNGIWRRLGLSAAKIAAKPKPVGCYSYNSLTSLRGKVIARTGYGPARGVMVPEPYFALMLDQP